jgi:hypothetical protein
MVRRLLFSWQFNRLCLSLNAYGAQAALEHERQQLADARHTAMVALLEAQDAYKDLQAQARAAWHALRYHLVQAAATDAPYYAALATQEAGVVQGRLAALVGDADAQRCRDLSYKPAWARG